MTRVECVDFRRSLRRETQASCISTVPEKRVSGGGVLDVFNPFYSFGEEGMPLARVHRDLIENLEQKEPNMLTSWPR